MIGSRVLVAYGTKHGSTREVAEAIGEVLRKRAVEADVRPAAEVKDLSPYSAVVLGGALYTGRWHPDARRLESVHLRYLRAIRVGPAVARADLHHGMGRVEVRDASNDAVAAIATTRSGTG